VPTRDYRVNPIKIFGCRLAYLTD